MRIKPLAVAAAVLTVLLAAGCESSGEKKPTPKEEATRKWNAARASVLASLAKDQYQGGNFEKCRQTVDEALRLTPENAGLHIMSAKLYIEKGQLESAERELTTARQFAPNDGETHYLSGVVYQRWQKPEKALEFYKVAADKSPAEMAYWLAQAEMLVSMDRTPDALAVLEGRVDYFENSGTIRDAVGQLLMQLRRYKDAAAVLRRASILSEDDLTIRERFGLALYFNKDYREAADVVNQLVQKEPFDKRADLFIVLGESYLQTGRPREARYSFESATQIDPTSTPAWRGLGRAALETGDLKRAELSLNRAVKLDAAVAESHLMLGYLRIKQGRFQEALSSFETASSLDHKDPVSLCMAGYVLEKLGRPGPAAQYYGKALRIKPGDDLATQLMAGVDLND